MVINGAKAKEEARYDGKWVLVISTDLPAAEVAVRYKELWQVEQVFRTTKNLLKTRPIYHQNDAAIMGHVFVSFLALMLLKELHFRLKESLEWDEVRQDLDALYEVEVAQEEKTFVLRSPLQGVAGQVFKAIGVAVPPTVKEAKPNATSAFSGLEMPNYLGFLKLQCSR